jgi:hypothetical protein
MAIGKRPEHDHSRRFLLLATGISPCRFDARKQTGVGLLERRRSGQSNIAQS